MGRVMVGMVIERPALVVLGLLVTAALAVTACGGGKEETPPPAPEVIEPTPTDEPAVVEEAPPLQPLPEPEPPAPVAPEPGTVADRELLAYGDSQPGAITTAGGELQYRFSGEVGDLVRISVDGKEGMDPVVTLSEPNRTEIASNDDVGAFNTDALVIARLPSAGLQVVRVTAFEELVGTFVITIERLPTDSDNDSASLNPGNSGRGQIGEPGDIDEFRFAGDEGQHLVIVADGEIGVDMFLQVFGPDGSFVLADDDSGHGLDAELDVVLPVTGGYRAEVTAVGNRIGAYTFTIALAEEPLPPTPEDQTAMEAVALQYLSALQNGDALLLYGLAGPEARVLWGWESAADVERSVARLQEIGVLGTPGLTTIRLRGQYAQAAVELTPPEATQPDRLIFDLINVSGQWLVDAVARLAAPAASSGG